MQRALMQYDKPYNHATVASALRKAGREDLIGTGPECLVRPQRTFGGRTAIPEKSRSAADKGAKPTRRGEKRTAGGEWRKTDGRREKMPKSGKGREGANYPKTGKNGNRGGGRKR